MQIFLGYELMFEYFRLPAPERAIAPHCTGEGHSTSRLICPLSFYTMGVGDWESVDLKLLPVLQAAPGGKADGNERKEQPRDLGFYG